MCEVVTLRPQPIEAPVDVVWAIDSSRSMQDERARLQATINDFAQRVRAEVADLHVVTLSELDLVPAPLGTDPSSYLFVPFYVDSKEALRVLIDQAPSYQAFLRPDALLHLVIVSDDDSLLSAEEFRQRADATFGRPYTLHAIASPDVNGEPCRSEVPSPICLQSGIQAVCGAALVGAEYYRAAELTEGLTINVCLDDWSRVLGPLSDAVVGAMPIPCGNELSLATAPQTVDARLVVSGLDPQPFTQVDGAASCGDGALSFYRELTAGASQQRVVLCPWACGEVERSGGNVEIGLDCATDSVPVD